MALNISPPCPPPGVMCRVAVYQPRLHSHVAGGSPSVLLSPWLGVRLCHQSSRCHQSSISFRLEVRASTAVAIAEASVVGTFHGSSTEWNRSFGGEVSSRGTGVVPFEEDARSLREKYRPQKFGDLVGHASLATSLARQVKRGKPHRAYLFNGPRGTGKTSAARILAAAVNCAQNFTPGEQRGDPCGICSSCRAIFSGESVDVKEVDAASHSGVDNMRSLLESVQYRPVMSRFKVYILDECHMLSGGAANAVLKTLEEPPSHVIFILVTTDPQRLPITVKDRCQEYLFRKIRKGDTVSALRQVADREGVQLADNALELLAHLSEGSMRDAVKKLERVAECEEEVTLQLIEDVFNIQASLQPLALLSTALDADQEMATVQAAESLLEEVDAIQLAGALMGLVVDLVSKSARLDYPKADPLQEAARKKLTNMAGKRAGKKRLKYALALLSEMDSRIRLTHRPDLLLKTALLQLSSFPPPPLPPVFQQLAPEGAYSSAEGQGEDAGDTVGLVSFPTGGLQEQIAEGVGDAGGGGGDGGGLVETPLGGGIIPAEAQEESQEGNTEVAGAGAVDHDGKEDGAAPPSAQVASEAELEELAAVNERALRWLVDRKEEEREAHRGLFRSARLLSLCGSQATLGFPSPALLEKGGKRFAMAAFTRALSHAAGKEIELAAVICESKPRKGTRAATKKIKKAPALEVVPTLAPTGGYSSTTHVLNPRLVEGPMEGKGFRSRTPHTSAPSTRGIRKGGYSAQALPARSEQASCPTGVRKVWRRGGKARASSGEGGQAGEGVGEGGTGRGLDRGDGEKVVFGPDDLMEVAKKLACSFGGKVVKSVQRVASGCE